MKRNLFLFCEEKNRERFQLKIRKTFEDSVAIVGDVGQADFVYAVGAVTPDMQQQLTDYEKSGIKIVCVNENLINESVFDQVFRYQSRSRNSERER